MREKEKSARASVFRRRVGEAPDPTAGEGLLPRLDLEPAPCLAPGPFGNPEGLAFALAAFGGDRAVGEEGAEDGNRLGDLGGGSVAVADELVGPAGRRPEPADPDAVGGRVEGEAEARGLGTQVGLDRTEDPFVGVIRVGGDEELAAGGAGDPDGAPAAIEGFPAALFVQMADNQHGDARLDGEPGELPEHEADVLI